MSDVAIVGAGLMGTAIAWPLADNGHRVRLVGTHLDGEIIASCLAKRYHPRLRRTLPDGVKPFFIEQIAQALEGVEVVVSGVNSLGVHWIGRTLAPLLQTGATIIAVTKGLEATPAGDLRILPDVLADELPAALRRQVSIAAVGGPCIAGELAGRRPSCVVFAAAPTDEAALHRLRSLFKTSYYHISISTDITGVEVCAALKNAYTLAVGLAYGVLEQAGGVDEAGAAMHNLAAAFFGASATEMARLVSLLGGSSRLVAGLPGVGDEYVTAVGGRTIRMGRLLGMGLTYKQAVQQMAGETLEGPYVVQQLAKALPIWEAEGRIGRGELPVLRLLCRTVTEDAPARISLDELFPDRVP